MMYVSASQEECIPDSSSLFDGAVALWDYDESSGPTSYDSIDSYNGTIYNAIVDNTGILDGCYYYDGTGDYVDYGDAFDLGSGEFTISMWAKKSTSAYQAYNTIIGKGYLTGTGQWHLYEYNTNNNWNFYGDGSKKFEFTADAGQRWCHILLSRADDDSLRVYVDGSRVTPSLDQVSDNTVDYTNSSDLTVGARQNGTSGFFDGYIDQIVFWSRALTGDERDSVYNSGDGYYFGDWVTPCGGSSPPPPPEEGDYYVSSSEGDDGNNGTSPETAWETLNKVNISSFFAGDTILFKKGDNWEGTLTIPSSGSSGNPIVFGSYSTGAKPQIYGSDTITGWTLHSGNIYKAYYTTTINQLFLDSVKMRAAREPNAGNFPTSGYHPITSVQSSVQFTADDLNASIDYTDAIWFGRTHYWMTETRNVTTSSSKTLTLNSVPSASLNTGEGFFLMNKLDFLDEAGEWYYDSSIDTVYVWTPDDSTPSDNLVRGSIHDDGIYINNKDYITIEGFDILHQSINCINLNSADYIVINDNVMYYPDGYGVFDDDYSDRNTITNNIVTGANHTGIYLRTDTAIVEDNQILETCLFDNIGLSGNSSSGNLGQAMFISGDSNKVRYNRIIYAGYNGIYFARRSNIIQYNFIDSTLLLKSDGGGIYTSYATEPGTAGSIVRNNIVLNSVGEKYGYTSTRNLGEGIYIDESAEDVVVDTNTVAYSSNSGIYLHDNSNTEVNDNTLFDGRYGIIINDEHSTVSDIHNNIIYAFDEDDYEVNQLIISKSGASTTFDYNSYYNHYNSSQIFKIGSYYDFAGWKTATGQDGNSTLDISALIGGDYEKLLYNNTKSSIDTTLTGSWDYLNGNPVSFPITIQSFESIILTGQ